MMKTGISIITLLLLLAAICGCGGPKSCETEGFYFECPSNAIRIASLDWESSQKLIIDNPDEEICIHFDSNDSAPRICSILNEVALYRTSIYINLGPSNIYYGFPVNDGYETHPWYIYWSENFIPSEAQSTASIYEIEVRPQGYVFSGREVSTKALKSALDECDTVDVMDVVLSEKSTFSELLPLLGKFHAKKIYQYVLSIEDTY